jgi:hypothetical protein
MDLLDLLLGGRHKEKKVKEAKHVMTREEAYEALERTAVKYPTWLVITKDEDGTVINVSLAKRERSDSVKGTLVHYLKRNAATRLCPTCGKEKGIKSQTGISYRCAWIENLACGHSVCITRFGSGLKDGQRIQADGRLVDRSLGNWNDLKFIGWRIDIAEVKL